MRMRAGEGRGAGMTEARCLKFFSPPVFKNLATEENPMSSGKAQNKTSRNNRHWQSGRAGARPPGGRVFVAQRKQGLFGGLERGLRRGGTPLLRPLSPARRATNYERWKTFISMHTLHQTNDLLSSLKELKNKKKKHWIPAFAGMTQENTWAEMTEENASTQSPPCKDFI